MFANIIGFDWDHGNFHKNREKHAVTFLEAEQVFFNEPLIVNDAEGHAASERRWFVLGQTDEHRLLMVVFTLRDDRIRVISARPMSRKERKVYEES